MDRHPVLTYTVLRLLLFLVALAVLFLLGARGLLLVALAVLLSGLVSLRLLSRQRDAMSVALTRSTHPRRTGVENAAVDVGAPEDDDDRRH
jgi:hypothetical protein